MSGVDRREFLQLAGGVIVLLAAPPALAQETGRRPGAEDVPQELSAWLQIAEDGTVSVYTGKVEVGQNIRTSLAQAVAEELRVPIDAVHMVMGDTDLTPFDMGTFGSRTTPTMALQLRRAAATAREMLIDLAAQQWLVDRSTISVDDSKVTHAASGRAIGYGTLTKGRKLVRTIPHDVPLTPADHWSVAGRTVHKINGRDFVTGRHRYASDIVRPGMGYGKVFRPPAFGATLVGVGSNSLMDATAVREGDFAAIVADTQAALRQAVAGAKPQWKPAPAQASSSKTIYDDLRKLTAGREAPYTVGSVADGAKNAPHRLERTYTVAYIAHVPLEPRAAVAEWNEGKLTVWTGTQRPFAVKSELAEALGVPAEKVRVIVPDTGSAYGGKHTGECAIEAARMAKVAGQPVRLVWTREEEMTWAYFRPAGVIDVKSAAAANGKLMSWQFDNYNSGPAAIRTPYEVPNQRIEYHPCKSPLRQGSYRGLAATANHFARESHMDELAAELSIDPLEMRRRNLADPRLRAVLDAAADRFGWGKSKAEGIACGVEKGGYTATCAEVSVDGNGEVHVERLVTAFECGAVVNPDGLRNQIEGALIQGIGGALFEAIEFGEGKIANNKLSQYRVPRFSDMPRIEVILLDRKDLPSAGAGETPIVGVAPAIAGAIFAVTGKRLRALPLAPRGLKL